MVFAHQWDAWSIWVFWKSTDDEKSFDDYDSAEDHTKVGLNEITDDTIKCAKGKENYTCDFCNK